MEKNQIVATKQNWNICNLRKYNELEISEVAKHFLLSLIQNDLEEIVLRWIQWITSKSENHANLTKELLRTIILRSFELRYDGNSIFLFKDLNSLEISRTDLHVNTQKYLDVIFSYHELFFSGKKQTFGKRKVFFSFRYNKLFSESDLRLNMTKIFLVSIMKGGAGDPIRFEQCRQFIIMLFTSIINEVYESTVVSRNTNRGDGGLHKDTNVREVIGFVSDLLYGIPVVK